MTWKITFYSEKVEQQTLKLPPGILADLLRTIELIEEFGPGIGRPHTAPLRDGLLEIRAKGKEGIARSICCAVKGREIVVLLTVIKKRNRIPKHQMDTALKRMKEIQNG